MSINDSNKDWYVIDATDVVLGRLASKVATLDAKRPKTTSVASITYQSLLLSFILTDRDFTHLTMRIQVIILEYSKREQIYA